MEAVKMEPVSHHNDAYPHVKQSDFDVIAAFSGLDTSRKMALFDQLMCGRANAYRNTLKSLMPQSDEHDARKLEIVLRARLDRLKQYS